MNKITNAYELTHDVERLVTPEFLQGATLADTSDFRTQNETKVNLDALAKVADALRARFDARDAAADAWLAPRLHYVLRLTRREAGNQGFWRWLALEPMCSVVRHRWADKSKNVKAYRYLGGSNFLRRNALSRLWWAAEVMRNGSDYAEVVPLLGSSAIEQYVLDLKFGHLRPSAIAFSRVARGVVSGTKPLSFEETKDFSKRVNLLLSATSLENLAVPGNDDVDETDHEWFADGVDIDDAVELDVKDLRGPSDGAAMAEEIADYETWFAEVARQVVATKGGRKQSESPAPGE